MPEKQDEAARLRRTLEILEDIREAMGDEACRTASELVHRRLAELESSGRKQLRKYVTVVFADVTGFTSICEQHDAEYVTRLINTLWDALDTTVIEHGGVVDKHIGDAVMALWGTEKVREDDTLRAIRAALAMQEKARGMMFDQRKGISGFHMRIGVHSGPVFLGSIGLNREYTAMGDTVNIASRLQSSAPEGSVVVSHDAYRHVRDDFTFEARDPVSLKGIVNPIRTWVVVSATPRSFQRVYSGITGMEAPMVGRNMELDRLVAALEEVTSRSRPLAVTVSGEAGIGKSRLLQEFRLLVEREDEDTVFFNARCTPEMRNIPCAVYRDVLRFRMSVREDEPADSALEKLRAGMGRYLSDDEVCLACHYAGFDLSHTEPVKKLMGSPILGSEGSSALLKYFRDTCRDNRVLMYLEDLHWADPTSLDLTLRLTGEIMEGRLLILALTRPPLFEVHPEWGSGEGCLLIRLGSLDDKASADLVSILLSRVRDIPEDLSGHIMKAAEGNPFYIEELVAMMLDRGAIAREGDGFRFDPDGMLEWVVPSTLTGVLQSRLDSLPDEEKDLLQRASVIGRSFWDVALKALCERSREAEIDNGLESVRERDLVQENDSSTFAGSAEYLFKHAILRDVTYDTVLLEPRRRLHRLTAEWLIHRSSGRISEFAGLIAEHFYRGEDWESAIEWLIRSGRTAYSTSAYPEALFAFQRALEILPADHGAEVAAELHLWAGKTLDRLTRYTEAEEHLEQAVETASCRDLHAITADALLGLSWLANVRGRWEDRRDYGTRAYDEARRSGDRAVLAKAIMRMTDFVEEDGYDARIEMYREAYEIYRELDDKGGLAIASLNMGNLAMGFEREDEAERYYEEGLQHYEDIGDKWGIANCLGNLGNVALSRKDYEMSRDLHLRSRDISQSIGDMEGVIICNLNLGRDEHNLGDHGRGIGHHFEALRLASELGIPPLALGALYELSVQMRRNGDLRSAALALLAIDKMKDAFIKEGPDMDPGADLEEVMENIPADEMEEIKTLVDRASLVEIAAALCREGY